MQRRDTLAIVVAVLTCGCKRSGSHEQQPPPSSPDAIPHTTGPIKIDGEWDEPDWPERAQRGQFRAANGELARPSSEVRLLHDDRDLIVALYAADENIETSDAFDLGVGMLALHVDASGTVTPFTPGVRAAVGYDEGTRDDPKDDDEEWVVEIAMPLANIGLLPGIPKIVSAARCDVPKDGVRRCGSWSASVTAN